MRVWGDKEALWGRGWAGEMHCTVVRLVAWGWEMGWGQLGVPQTPPPPLPTELPQALRLGPPDVASTSVPWWFWDRRGMSTAPSSQRLCSPNPPCPKQRARHLPPTLRGRKEGMKVLLGRTKIPSEALGCWRWDVGEKRLEKVFPHDIARVRSSRITLISDK